MSTRSSILRGRSKSTCSTVCEQCGFEALISRRLQNVNSGRLCVKCGARLCGEASRIDSGVGGGTTSINGSRRDSTDSGGHVISDIGGGLSANKRKRSHELESYSNCSIMLKSYGNNNLGPSDSMESKPEPYYVICSHCNSHFYGLELYEKHFPCHLAPFLLEIQLNERRLESIQNQILNCEHLFERFSKFVDGRKNLSSQPVAVVENIEVEQNVESDDDISKSQSGEETISESKIFNPKVPFCKKAPVMPNAFKVPNSYYNRIQKSKQIRAKVRAGKCFVYLESHLVDKQQMVQVKQILALEREVREMHAELLIIESNSVLNSVWHLKNSSDSVVPQVATEEPQDKEKDQIKILYQNKVLEELEYLPGPEPMEPVLDPLLYEEYSRRVLDHTNLMVPESNTSVVYEFPSQIPLNPGYYDGGNGSQNENYSHNDWICRQCFDLFTELIRRQINTDNIEPIQHDFYGDLLSMDANCSLPPYCCAFYLNSVFLEEIESAIKQILDNEN